MSVAPDEGSRIIWFQEVGSSAGLRLGEELFWVVDGSWSSRRGWLGEQADGAAQRSLPAMTLDARWRTRAAGGTGKVMKVDRVGEESMRC